MVPRDPSRIFRSRWSVAIGLGVAAAMAWYLVPTDARDSNAAEVAAIARSQGLAH